MYPPLAAFSTRLDVPSHYLTVFIPLAVNVSFPNHIPPLLTASFIPFTTFGPVSISHLNFFFFIIHRSADTATLTLTFFAHFYSLVGSLSLPL